MPRRAQIIARVEGDTVVPFARIDREAIAAMPKGTVLELKPFVEKDHSLGRAMHAMCGLAADNVPGWSVERIKTTVKLRHGWISGVREKFGGENYVELRSVNDFTDDEMREFMRQIEEFITTELMPGVDLETLRRETREATKARKFGVSI